MPKATPKLPAFRCFFDITAVSNIPDTFEDLGMSMEVEKKNMEAAACDAFFAFTQKLYGEKRPIVMTAIRLTRIVSMDGPPEVRLFLPPEEAALIQMCRVCGCTDEDCTQCIKRTGRPCSWVEDDLCSACKSPRKPRAAAAKRPPAVKKG